MEAVATHTHTSEEQAGRPNRPSYGVAEHDGSPRPYDLVYNLYSQ